MFSYDNSAETLKAATDKVIQRLDGEELDLPIAFDWEDFGAFQTYKMSFYDLNKLYDVFEEEMNAAGYDTMLYSSLIYLENVWSKKDTRPVWLAQYADKPDYNGPYMMWQASDTGRIDGIDGDVDMDILTK
jgi:GH25 family lysozyme M1 (1,4-beta-N-acetylmuramidase)